MISDLGIRLEECGRQFLRIKGLYATISWEINQRSTQNKGVANETILDASMALSFYQLGNLDFRFNIFLFS